MSTSSDFEALARLLEKAAATIRELSKTAEQLKYLVDPDDILGKSIRHLNLSIRAERCLRYGGIDFIGQLVDRSEINLLEFRNFGETTLCNVKTKLENHGLKLKGN